MTTAAIGKRFAMILTILLQMFWSDAKEKASNQIYAVVLPLNLVALLRSETDEEIIQPVSGREQSDSQIFNQAMGKMESEYIYRHLYWQKIIKVEIITERL